MDGWGRWVRLGLTLALLVAIYFLVPDSADPDRSELLRIVLCLVLIVILTLGIVWQVRLQMLDSARHVDGLVIALVVAVLVFAAAFYVIAQRDPDQIVGIDTRLDALYFTLSTLLTVGYGDVHAVGQLARGIVLVQMVFNVAVIATAATSITARVRQKAIEHAQRVAADPGRSERRHRGGRERRTQRHP